MRLTLDRASVNEPLRSFLDMKLGELALHMRNKRDV
jgi:hypothetical protein